MDHAEATRLNAAERYLLGELAPNLRDEYEEHFFVCSQCAEDLKAGAAFVDAARQALCEKPEHVADQAHSEAVPGWWSWLRPAIAVPAFALLLVLIGYQSLVTIPRIRQAASSPQVLKSFSLIAAAARSEGSMLVRVGSHEPFGLYVDIPPERPFASYVCQVQDEAQRVFMRVRVAAADATRTVQVLVPGGVLHPGRYSLVIFGAAQDGKVAADNEVARLLFTVEHLR